MGTPFGMFEECSSLSDLDISNFDTSKVGSMENLFNGCSNLKTLKLGEKFTFIVKTDTYYYLPSGTWYSADGTAYTSNGTTCTIPNNKADTYTRR